MQTNKAYDLAIYALELAIIREREGSDLTPDVAIRFYEKTIAALKAAAPQNKEGG